MELRFSWPLGWARLARLARLTRRLAWFAGQPHYEVYAIGGGAFQRHGLYYEVLL